MKKIYLAITCILLLVVFTGCNKKSVFLSEKEIKSNFTNFDIVANFNGIKFRLIKTSSGYYYENQTSNEYLYYNRNTNKSYAVDNDSQYKILVNGNYDFSEYLNNVYYILTYHLSRSNIVNYNTNETTYINRDVIEYSREEGDLIEKYYIDKELGGCLYFLIDDGNKRIICQIDSIVFGKNLLDPYEAYLDLEKADLTEFKNKETIISNLTSYDITFKIINNIYHIIKSDEGFLYHIKVDDNESMMLYDDKNAQWYKLNLEDKTKIIINDDTAVVEYESEILTLLLLSHLSNVNKNFYQANSKVVVDLDAIEYIYTSGSITQKFYVNLESGLCLKRVTKVDNIETVFEVTNIAFNGDISEYLAYDLSKNQTYQVYPSSHPFLEGIEALDTYGKYYVGYEISGELTIIYNNVSVYSLSSLIDKFKNDYQFNLNIDEIIPLTDVMLQGYYRYIAKRSDGLVIAIEYNMEIKQFSFTICSE